MSSPLISLCMITKNAEAFLPYSIGSVWPFVDELIVIDDGSTDRTAGIAQSFKNKKEKRVIYISDNFGDKTKQRNEYLKHAKGKWILALDDDEVISNNDMSELRRICRDTEKYDYIVLKHIHFWKDFDHHIDGHVWRQSLERLFRNYKGIHYKKHLQININDEETFISHAKKNRSFFNLRETPIRLYHYSYCRPREILYRNIRYYMLRDKPGIHEHNADEWTLKHPYFSDNFDQPRYGDDGLYCCGSTNHMIDRLYEFKGKHPFIMVGHPMHSDHEKYKSYSEGMNAYMENHWQYNNHLTYPRHMERMKYTAEFCEGKTLDVGCANGFSTYIMGEHNKEAQFDGIEPTKWGYAQAKKIYTGNKFYNAIGENLPFENKTYDTVLLSEVIEHCSDPRVFADEAFRICKKRLIITTPTQMHNDPDHKRFFSLKEMKEFLTPYAGKLNFHGLTVKGERTTTKRDIYFQIAVLDL